MASAAKQQSFQSVMEGFLAPLLSLGKNGGDNKAKLREAKKACLAPLLYVLLRSTPSCG